MSSATQYKKSKRLCIVKGCDNHDGKGVSLFKLPMNSDRCVQWLKALDREDLIIKALFRPHSYSVCFEHFDNVSFKKSLRQDAVPVNVRQQKSLQSKPNLKTFEMQFSEYVSSEGRFNWDRDASTSTEPVPLATGASSTQFQRTHSTSIGTQTEVEPEQAEKNTDSSQYLTDLMLKERKYLEEARVAQYKYIRNFVRKKGLRKPNSLLSHRCTEDHACKKFCKLIENQKKLL